MSIRNITFTSPTTWMAIGMFALAAILIFGLGSVILPLLFTMFGMVQIPRKLA